jgi:hypothetical protein
MDENRAALQLQDDDAEEEENRRQEREGSFERR